MAGHLTVVYQFRITPQLATRLQETADKWGLRPQDVARALIARGLAEGLAIGEPGQVSDRRELEGVTGAKHNGK